MVSATAIARADCAQSLPRLSGHQFAAPTRDCVNWGYSKRPLAHASATLNGERLYLALSARAAAVMESLVGNHLFVDGNKRVRITAPALFLRRNGLRLTSGNEDHEAFVLHMARGEAPLEQKTQCLRTHMTPLQVFPRLDF